MLFLNKPAATTSHYFFLKYMSSSCSLKGRKAALTEQGQGLPFLCLGLAPALLLPNSFAVIEHRCWLTTTTTHRASNSVQETQWKEISSFFIFCNFFLTTMYCLRCSLSISHKKCRMLHFYDILIDLLKRVIILFTHLSKGMAIVFLRILIFQMYPFPLTFWHFVSKKSTWKHPDPASFLQK